MQRNRDGQYANHRETSHEHRKSLWHWNSYTLSAGLAASLIQFGQIVSSDKLIRRVDFLAGALVCTVAFGLAVWAVAVLISDIRTKANKVNQQPVKQEKLTREDDEEIAD